MSKRPTTRAPRLAVEKQEQLIEAFANAESISSTAQETGINKNTVERYFRKLRNVIIESKSKISIKYSGDICLPSDFYKNCKNGFTKPTKNSAKPEIGIKIWKDKIIAFRISNEKVNRSECDIDGIVYRFNGSTSGDIKKRAKRYQLVLSEKIIQDDLPFEYINRFYNIACERISKCNGLDQDALDCYIKECEWRTNTPSTHWAYELTRLAKESFCQDLALGQKPILKLGDDPAMVRAIEKMMKNSKTA
ncbi:TPA: hypothetical protein ACSP21_000250 [Aeromonas veronii]